MTTTGIHSIHSIHATIRDQHPPRQPLHLVRRIIKHPVRLVKIGRSAIVPFPQTNHMVTAERFERTLRYPAHILTGLLLTQQCPAHTAIPTSERRYREQACPLGLMPSRSAHKTSPLRTSSGRRLRTVLSASLRPNCCSTSASTSHCVKGPGLSEHRRDKACRVRACIRPVLTSAAAANDVSGLPLRVGAVDTLKSDIDCLPTFFVIAAVAAAAFFLLGQESEAMTIGREA